MYVKCLIYVWHMLGGMIVLCLICQFYEVLNKTTGDFIVYEYWP